MCPFSAPDDRLELRDSIRKYLNYMEFVQTASPDTLRAYKTDLSQAFRFSEFEIEEKSPKAGRLSAPRRLSDDLLLAACRQAQSRWSKLSPASRNRKAACLKSFLKWLHQNSAIERDLAAQIHAPKVPHRLPHHLSVDEALALLQSLKAAASQASTTADGDLAFRDQALILLLYGGGLRVSEACSLRWNQIESGARMLRIKGKGGKERLVALPEMVANALLNLKKRAKQSEYVFGESGLSTRKAYEIVRNRGAQAALNQPLHPHALRHSFATHLLLSGANLRSLQELLGHQTLQATQRYTHLGIDHLARTMEACHPLGENQSGRKAQRKKSVGSGP